MSDGRRDREAGEMRTMGVRLRKYIDVVVEDAPSAMLFRAAIADISETGMRLISDQYLAKGTSYLFTMKRAPSLALHGEVRWIRSWERDAFQVGVLFVDATEEDCKRLTSFLAQERNRTSTRG